MTSLSEVHEAMAALEHARWASWMLYLFAQSSDNEDGSVTIPPGLVERWDRQMRTPYGELTEREKDSDRAEVDKTLTLIESKGFVIAHREDVP